MSAPVPPQWGDQVVFDFRGATTEARGYKAKRKREVEELAEQARPLVCACQTLQPSAVQRKHHILSACTSSSFVLLSLHSAMQCWKALGTGLSPYAVSLSLSAAEHNDVGSLPAAELC